MSKSVYDRYQYRKERVRNKIVGTGLRPRLSIFRSLKHLYAQVIDDTTGKTLASACTLEKAVRDQVKKTGNVQSAIAVGKLIAQKAAKAKIKKVVFDRGGRIYHGSIKALAEAARENGLEF